MVAIVVLYVINLGWLGFYSYKRVKQNKNESKLFIFCVLMYVLLSTILLGLVLSFTLRYHSSPINPTLSQTALGGVSTDSIAIWARDASATSFVVEYKQIGQTTWIKSPSTMLGSESDFTGVIRLSGLVPSTTYDYRTLRQDDSLITQGTFRTLQAGGSILTFAWGSCLMVGRTYSRKLAGLGQLQNEKPDFYFLIGDNIYADIPWLNIGLGTIVDRYRSSYRETIGTDDFTRLRASIPGFYQLDDHEFINNYDEPNNTAVYRAARRAFFEYLSSPNPVSDPSEYFYNFTAGNATFFVFDTRAHRPEYIVGPAQLTAVQTWLTNAQQAGIAFKFLISPQSVTQNFKATTEGWVSYPQEREALLDFIEQNNITGCIFLSGDMHQVGVFELRPNLFEISASPVDGSGRTADHTPRGIDRELFKSYFHNIGFGVVQVDETVSPPVVTIRTHQSGGNVVMEMVRSVAGVVVCSVFLLTCHFYYVEGACNRLMKGGRGQASDCGSVKLTAEGTATVVATSEDSPPSSPVAVAVVTKKKCFLPPGPTLIAFSVSCLIIFIALVASPDTKTNFAIQIDANNNYRIL